MKRKINWFIIFSYYNIIRYNIIREDEPIINKLYFRLIILILLNNLFISIYVTFKYIVVFSRNTENQNSLKVYHFP